MIIFVIGALPRFLCQQLDNSTVIQADEIGRYVRPVDRG
jgi:hypothetical protein